MVNTFVVISFMICVRILHTGFRLFGKPDQCLACSPRVRLFMGLGSGWIKPKTLLYLLFLR
jgi:hypothetical protein